MYVQQDLKPILEMLKEEKKIIKVSEFERRTKQYQSSIAKILCGAGSGWIPSSEIDLMNAEILRLRDRLNAALPEKMRYVVPVAKQDPAAAVKKAPAKKSPSKKKSV